MNSINEAPLPTHDPETLKMDTRYFLGDTVIRNIAGHNIARVHRGDHYKVIRVGSDCERGIVYIQVLIENTDGVVPVYYSHLECLYRNSVSLDDFTKYLTKEDAEEVVCSGCCIEVVKSVADCVETTAAVAKDVIKLDHSLNYLQRLFRELEGKIEK